MAEACYSDQQMLGAKGGSKPKPAPPKARPKMAMKGGTLRKPGGGKK